MRGLVSPAPVTASRRFAATDAPATVRPVLAVDVQRWVGWSAASYER
jgi:hypothetical protein